MQREAYVSIGLSLKISKISAAPSGPSGLNLTLKVSNGRCLIKLIMFCALSLANQMQ